MLGEAHHCESGGLGGGATPPVASPVQFRAVVEVAVDLDDQSESAEEEIDSADPTLSAEVPVRSGSWRPAATARARK
ncbi:MAG TPA: hypothetical protein VGR26_13785 [Acidimicrobiales bacterium]|nr:hypothetical protein [Acidimicrobiales bacterium]